jgi:P27 family predicted phage terminase small subunit
MGRRALPTNLHILRGNPNNKTKAALFGTPGETVRPPVVVPKCPEFLQGDARAEWFRISKHLEPLGLVSEIDRGALAGYCAAWGDFAWSERRIAELNSGSIDGEAGRISATQSGFKQVNVVMQIRNRALELMGKFLAEFGMSPASRSKVSASDRQRALPGMDNLTEGGWGSL